jgi:hypothetical protein
VPVGAACNSDEDCEAGDACDPDGLVCVAAGPADSVAVGGYCIDDAECDIGEYCDNAGICETDTYTAGSESPGQPCYDDADCADSYCDIQTDTCV